MKPKYYNSERAARKACRITRAMWPEHKFEAHMLGFSGWAVYLIRDGKPAAPVGALKPLPFHVTASGECILFRAYGVDGERHHVFSTHRKALNMLHRIRGLHVAPVPFVGPLQPHVQRRVKIMAQMQHELF